MHERTRFESESASLRLAEYDQRSPLDSGNKEYVVGERIKLNLDQYVLGSRRVEKVRWKIPGRIVYSYGGDANGSALIDFDSKYFGNREIEFFWVDADDSRRISCSAIVWDGGQRLPVTVVSKPFDVKGPKLVSFTATTSKPKIIGGPGSSVRISFGERQTDTPGIAWDCRIDLPKNFAGSIKDLQLVRWGRKKTQLLAPRGKDVRQMVKGPAFPNKNFLLDIGTMEDDECKPDRALDDPKYSRIIKTKPGESLIFNTANDSPSDGLAPLDISYSVNEDFRYFVLFKPDKPNSVWVPVGVADWFWKAEARKQSGSWRILSGSGGVRGGKGKATTEFPQYNGNACNILWT